MNIRFSAFHPVVNFCYYTGSIALIMLLMHPILLVVALVIILAIHYFTDHFNNLKQWLFLIIITGTLIQIMNPIFNERGRHLLFSLWGHRITLEATLYGGMSALSIISIMAVFVSYNTIMSPNKLLYLFSKFLPQFAILLMLTLRFIPLMRRRLVEISEVQMSKGNRINQGPLKERISKGMLYIQVLVTYSLEEAILTADSMKARGYGHFKRTSYEYYLWRKSDKIAIIYLVVLLVATLYGRYLGLGLLTIYPIMEPISLDPNEMVILLFSVLFLSFPLLVEIGEVVRWRLFN
jgi:energy-coupling factor transport system permease protein